MRFLTPFLLLGFVACSNPIFGVGIKDIDIDVSAAATTSGQVIYGTQSTFNRPTFAWTSTKLRGQASQKGFGAGTLRFNLYARSTPPQGCVPSNVCSNMSQAAFKINSTPLELKTDGSKTAFMLDDQNNAMRDALNAGTMTLGVEVLSGATVNSTVTLSDLVVDVTVL
jgi:hypothetical protein